MTLFCPSPLIMDLLAGSLTWNIYDSVTQPAQSPFLAINKHWIRLVSQKIDQRFFSKKKRQFDKMIMYDKGVKWLGPIEKM